MFAGSRFSMFFLVFNLRIKFVFLLEHVCRGSNMMGDLDLDDELTVLKVLHDLHSKR